jgi:hypothetical protein
MQDLSIIGNPPGGRLERTPEPPDLTPRDFIGAATELITCHNLSVTRQRGFFVEIQSVVPPVKRIRRRKT